ncbi:MAG: NAD(P)/FAD-dependent oxidoreductase [Phycisphaerae bacterium]
MSEPKVHDVIIVGAGPAGLAAALYSARDRYDTVLLEKNGLPGGQIMLTESIENYPGFKHVGGMELVEHMKQQVVDFGANILANKAVDSLSRRDEGLLELSVNRGEETFLARAVILAPGSDYRQLGVPGEDQLRQATRVSYCATCDGAFYRDKEVLVVGGGNTAVEDAVYLATRFTRKLTLIHRRTEFRAQKVLVEELQSLAEKDGSVEIKLPYVLDEIVPTESGTEVDHVRIRNVETDELEKLTVDGVFIFAGMIPNTSFLRDSVKMNEAGYIACDCVTLKTSLPGVFVAGDCRQQAAMQLATATADGVVAAMMMKDYFRSPDTWDETLGEDGVKER